IPNQDNTTIVLFCLNEKLTKPCEAPSARPTPAANEEAITYAVNNAASNVINNAINNVTNEIIRNAYDQETEATIDSHKARKNVSKTKYIVVVILAISIILIITALWYFAK
ncbi:MAG: hypothetical protein HQK89_07875, partial [Nitrospirae bacterium]|nr:hypothetical protein [Nitrospirota bacterium]